MFFNSAFAEEKTINKISKDALYNEIVEQGIMFPEVVLSQALLETGNFKSNIYKKNNNLFGMKMSKKRKTTAIGVNRHYAVYETWKYSVIDYKMWQNKIPSKHMKNQTTYISFLQKKYSQSEDYRIKIYKMLKNPH